VLSLYFNFAPNLNSFEFLFQVTVFKGNNLVFKVIVRHVWLDSLRKFAENTKK